MALAPYANNMNNLHRGFSTLLIVILLGGVALGLTLSLSTSSVWSIRGSVDAKVSNQAKSLVNACAEIALETLRENNGYTGTDSVLIGSNTCTYTVTNTGGSTRTITASGVVEDITRRVTITTNTFNPLVVSSWLEVP